MEEQLLMAAGAQQDRVAAAVHRPHVPLAVPKRCDVEVDPLETEDDGVLGMRPMLVREGGRIEIQLLVRPFVRAFGANVAGRPGLAAIAVGIPGADLPLPAAAAEREQIIRRVTLDLLESVASLPGIVIDALSVFPYFSGSKLTKEGSHVGTGRIPSRLYRGNHSC